MEVTYNRPGRIDFVSRGVDVNSATDRPRKPGKYATLKNVIVGIDGTLEPRSGLSERMSGGYGAVGGLTPVHSIRRLNDSSSGTPVWMNVYGIGTALVTESSASAGNLAIADAAGSYSGSPLAFSIYRPPAAIQPWMYIGDSTKMRKIRSDGTKHSIGLPAPTTEPVAFAATGLFKTIYSPVTGAAGADGWVGGGGGVVNGVTVAPHRVATTLTAHAPYEYTSLGGILVIQPAAMTSIGVGTILTTLFAGPINIDLLVAQINKGSTATTIASIMYDSGSTGLCSLVLGFSLTEVVTNGLLFNSTRNEYVRVRSVTVGPDGGISIRVSTTSTWAATDSVQMKESIVCYDTGGGGPLTTFAMTSEGMSFSTLAATGTYTFTKTVAVDLSTLNAGSNTAQSLDDWMHISLWTDKPESITEIKLLLDIDATTNDFAHNYYFRAISPSDLTPVTTNAQSALDNRLTQIARRTVDHIASTGGLNEPINDYEGYIKGSIRQRSSDPSGNNVSDPTDPSTGLPSSADQLTSGSSQWSEIRFRLRDMQKVGSDDSRGFRNIAAIRVSVVSTAAVNVQISSWCIHGGFAPDVDVDQADFGYQYAYRARVSTTGAVSDISPLSRNQVDATRQAIAVQLAQYTAVAEADYLDVFRIGGTLGTVSYVGSVANGASPLFVDRYSDVAVYAKGTADGTFNIDDPDLQPWPIADIPRSGTCTVAGTSISSANQFDLRWAPGTLMVIDGIPTTIYRVISTSRMEIVDNLGTRTAVSWTMPQPTLLGQPLQMLWGDSNFHDYMFACGDQLNPGTLYYSKPKSPDSTAIRRRLEITSNSDPLQNGFVFNGRAGVFSAQSLYYLEHNPGDPNGPISANITPNVKGLYARWALAVGRRGVAWLASDGIYITEGGGAKNLTDEDLRPLFWFGGRPGRDTNGVSAPYMPNPVGSEETFLRLSFDSNDNLRFIYRDSGGNMRCLLYDFTVEGWFPIVYQKPVNVIYAEEGRGVVNMIAGSGDSPTGHVYTIGGSADTYTDVGTAYPWQVRTLGYDFNDPRAQKQFGDIEVDVDPNNSTIAVQAGFDNFATTVPALNITNATRLTSIIDLSSGGGVFARNVALDLSGTPAAGQHPRLFVWEPAFVSHPEDSQLRATIYDAGDTGPKYVRGLFIEADTANAVRSVTLEYTGDDGTVASVVFPTVQHSVKSRIYYPVPVPFYGTNIRLRPTDAAKWKLYGYSLDADPAPPYSTEISAWTDDNDLGAKFLQGVVIDCDTKGAPVSFEVRGDNNALLTTIVGATASIRAQLAFAFTPAVRTHVMRLVPLSKARIFGVRWDWQSDSELVSYYESQETSFDLPGYKHVREVYVAYAAAANPLVLSLVADGTPIANIPQLPSSASYTRQRILIPAMKFKALQFTLSSASAFRLYSRDCAVHVKPMASTGDYDVVPLFGVPHRDRGVAVI